MDLLKERRDHNLGLKKLVAQSCCVHEVEDEVKYRELLKEVGWDNVALLDLGSDDEEAADGYTPKIHSPRFDPYDMDVCEKYYD